MQQQIIKQCNVPLHITGYLPVQYTYTFSLFFLIVEMMLNAICRKGVSPEVLPYANYVCAFPTYTLRCTRVCMVFQVNRTSQYICTAPVCVNI